MTGNATASPEVSLIRREVPEFEPTFQEELREEYGALGSFQAVSVLAEWVCERVEDGTGDDAVRRAFNAIEQLIADHRFALGDALAAEFIEATWDHPAAREHMGPMTRERAERM
jgi:hypothetical protein